MSWLPLVGSVQQTVKKSVTINSENESISLAVGDFETLLNGENAFSVSLWVKPSDVTDPGSIFSTVANDPNEFDGVSLSNRGAPDNNRLRYYLIDNFAGGNFIRRDFIHTMVNDTWYHIVATFTGVEDISSLAVYQDGVALSPDNTNDTNGNLIGDIEDATNLTFGNDDGGILGGAFQGKYTDITIWDIALSPSQVSTLYNGGKPGNPRVQINDTNLRMWLRVHEDQLFHPTARDSEGEATATYINIPVSDITTDVP